MSDFGKILALKDGWYNGRGVAPNKQWVRNFAHLWRQFWPRSLPLPAAVPTPDGNVLLEWKGYGNVTVDLDIGKEKAYFHAIDKSGKDIEREFSLAAGGKGTVEFFKFVAGYIQSAK